jgi:hypothetical protein
MDRKPQMMAEAAQLVEQHRSDGGNINEIIAKHANENGYSDQVCNSLVWCVNRQSFKQAMTVDKHDEPDIADPAAVKRARVKRVPVEEAPVKQASTVWQSIGKRANTRMQSGTVHTTSTSLDYGPVLRAHLDSEKRAATQASKMANAQARMTLEGMHTQTKLIRQVGLDKQASFKRTIAACEPEVQEILTTVLEKSAYQETLHTRQDLELLVPQALADFGRLKQAAEELVRVGAVQAALDELQGTIALDREAVSGKVRF